MHVRVMNTCLLGKWIDRLERGGESICIELLRRKYLGDKSIFQIKNVSGSQFWRGILKVRKWFQRGRVMEVGSGFQTRFWEDTRLGGCALKIEFDQLFRYCSNPNISVQELLGGGFHLSFRRSLTPGELQDWHRLRERVS